MKCQGDFVFRGIEHKDGGEFTNSNGQAIKYNPSYVVKVDERTDSGVFERKFKIPETDEILVNSFLALDPYTMIVLNFELSIYGSQIRLSVTGLEIL